MMPNYQRLTSTLSARLHRRSFLAISRLPVVPEQPPQRCSYHSMSTQLSALRGHTLGPPTMMPQIQAGRLLLSQSTRSFASFNPVDWWRNREEKKEAEKYKERMLKMADMAVFTVGDMHQELQEAVSSWKTKIPGISSSKEAQQAKQIHKITSALVNLLGHDATMKDLDSMGRKEKLQAALAAETSTEDLNIVIQQFRNMDMIHKIVRLRKSEGKDIPLTLEGTQSLVQQEGPRVVDKAYQKKMAKRYAKRFMRR